MQVFYGNKQEIGQIFYIIVRKILLNYKSASYKMYIVSFYPNKNECRTLFFKKEETECKKNMKKSR